MSNLSRLGGLFANRALQIINFFKAIVKNSGTIITLISSGVMSTLFALSMHKSISKKEITVWAIYLGWLFFSNKSVFIYLLENILSNSLMMRSTCPSKVVKRDIKPFVYAFMDVMIFIADLLWSGFLFSRFDFSCSPILISPTYIQNIVAHQSAESSIDISRQNCSDNVA